MVSSKTNGHLISFVIPTNIVKSYINAIGTACPSHQISQQESCEFISDRLELSLEEKTKLSILFRATGIDYRYTVLEDYKKRDGYLDFFPNTEDVKPFPSVSNRMEVYKRTALPVAAEAIENCLKSLPFFNPHSISHLITVSCTGMYAPGLDIELTDYLGLRTNIHRTAINFMGCYGAFNAMKVADAICKSEKDAKVLVVCVELCTLHLLKSKDEDQLLSSSLFGDGAAAVIISASPISDTTLSLESFYCELLRDGKDEMAWHISDFGFQMKLTSYVPDLIKGGIKKLTNNLLEYLDLDLKDVDFYAIHPGGKRILQVIESELDISKQDNQYAHDILRKYGNMSSPTVLFVLQSIFERLKPVDQGKNILSFAFGPGLTLESMLLKVNYN